MNKSPAWPGPGRQNALEAIADLYHTLPDDVATTWETDSRGTRWKGNSSPRACAIHGLLSPARGRATQSVSHFWTPSGLTDIHLSDALGFR
jgi:hypothetical protein